MEKLELKHLVSYLPHDLNVLHWNGEAKEYVEILQVLNVGNRHVLGSEKHKPILRSLSDMTNHEMNVLRFLKTSKEGCQWTKSDWNFIKDVQRFPSLQSYKIVQKLFEWHFDVFGLIEKGLAIDINTLNK